MKYSRRPRISQALRGEQGCCVTPALLTPERLPELLHHYSRKEVILISRRTSSPMIGLAEQFSKGPLTGYLTRVLRLIVYPRLLAKGPRISQDPRVAAYILDRQVVQSRLYHRRG